MNETDRHNITEILLKVALNTISLTQDSLSAEGDELIYSFLHSEYLRRSLRFFTFSTF